MKKLVFVWHWNKKINEQGFLADDSLIYAIRELSKKYDVEIVAKKNGLANTVLQSNGLTYVLFETKKEIIDYIINTRKPDLVFFNHHSAPYDDLLRPIVSEKSIHTGIYYSSPIRFYGKDLLSYWKHHRFRLYNLSKYHTSISYHLVHHPYQREELINYGVQRDRIFVAPKMADEDIFKPNHAGLKKWNCIYPGRCTEGYWKRPELAIEATKSLGYSLVMPGAKLNTTYEHVTTFDNWVPQERLVDLYNQSECLVITSNIVEMGPRVIPEAALCNIPIVCCSDAKACVSHVKNIGGFIASPNVEDISKKIRLACNTIVNSREFLLRNGYTNKLILNVLQTLI